MEPTMTALATLAKLLAQGGPTLALVLLLYAIHAGHLRLRREIEQVEAECERLRAEIAGLRSDVAEERAASRALASAATHALDDLAAGGPPHADR